MIHEHIKTFDLCSATSYSPGVHALDYGNNDTTPPEGFWLVIEANLTQTGL